MEGYSRLAALMDSQKEFSLFRRCQSIRTIRLLHLSAEIAHLSDQLGVLVEADRNSDDPEKQLYETHYAQQMRSQHHTTEIQQVHLWHDLDTKLRAHGALLLQHHHLASLPPATARQQAKLTDWLHDAEGGNSFLHGVEASLWNPEWSSDLTTLHTAPTDPLTRLINTQLVPLYHRTLAGRRHAAPPPAHHVHVADPYTGEGRTRLALHAYSDARIAAAVAALSTVLASLLPALGALALSFVGGVRARMAIVVALTCVFSGVLLGVTRARRVDVFVATSAFAAVLVVFVGNDCGGGAGAGAGGGPG